MQDRHINARPVRVPVLTHQDLGPEGWNTLHELAELRGRKQVGQQVLALLRWALWRAQHGEDTELTRAQLNELLYTVHDDPIESVA